MMVSKLVKGFYKVADPIISAVANPISTVAALISPNKTVKQVQDEYFKQSKTAQAIDFALGAATLGAGVAGTATAAGRQVATNIAKNVGRAAVKAPIKTAVAAAAVPVVVGAIKSKPREVISGVSKAPSELQQFGSDIAKVAVDPSIESAKQLVSNSPILSTATAVLGVGALAKAAAPVISGALTREAIQEQTEALTSTPPQLTAVAPKGAAEIPKAPQTPITPETQPLIATAGSGNGSKTRRKASRKAKTPSINQRVNVIVSNRANATGIRAKKTERIINREVLLN